MIKKVTLFFPLILITNIMSFGSGSTLPNNACCNTGHLNQCDGYPFLQIHSPTKDYARDLTQWQQFISKSDTNSKYETFSVIVDYSKSFRSERLTQFFFGNDLTNCNELLIQGGNPCNNPEEKNPKAWFADYFGLPGEYSSKITFCPKIQNTIIDLSAFISLDHLLSGLYAKINAPIIWTKWELCMDEKIIYNGNTDTYSASYMAETTIDRSSMAQNFSQYMSGGVTFGDMKSPMKYGLISNCGRTKTRLAEINLTLGYNFYKEQNNHFGIFGYISAPTGNRPDAKYIFEPIAGNGKHWELGAGLTASWTFWESEACEDRYLTLWLEATVSHLCKTNQCRSFDFCNKPNSRYMLLAEIGPNNNGIKLGDNTTIATTNNYQYAKNLIPAINWSTFKVDVKIPLQADIALACEWVKEKWNFNIGYNLWARTGEKFYNYCDKTDKKYTIKGDSYLYGKEFANATETILPLPISQSLADIHLGKNWPATSEEDPRTNTGIDNPKKAWSRNNNRLFKATTFSPPGINPQNEQMNGSQDPIFVSRNMLNLGKSPSSVTHKIFTHLNYTWKNKTNDYIPFLGIGGKVELAQDNYNKCNSYSTTTCDNNNFNCENSSKKAGCSMWGIWINTGLTFN